MTTVTRKITKKTTSKLQNEAVRYQKQKGLADFAYTQIAVTRPVQRSGEAGNGISQIEL